MPIRTFRDPSGAEWDVFEVRRLNNRPTSVRPALAAGWLAFASGGMKRRLAKYPPEWIDLTDDELYELLGAAFTVVDPSTARATREVTVSTSMPTGLSKGGLPVAPPATASTVLGSRGTDELIRAHARQARQNGASVIEGMIEVKRALSEAGEDVSPHAIKLHRKVFVDEFYFSQRADHWARLH